MPRRVAKPAPSRPCEVIRTAYGHTPTPWLQVALPLTPSLNETKRWHYTITRDARKAAAEEFQYACGGQRIWSVWPPGLRVVIVTRCGTKLIDDDNVSGGFKHVRDAMVDCGILPGDGPHQVSFLYEQRVRSGGEPTHTHVTVRCA